MILSTYDIYIDGSTTLCSQDKMDFKSIIYLIWTFQGNGVVA